jgi:hypothetical protein
MDVFIYPDTSQVSVNAGYHDSNLTILLSLYFSEPLLEGELDLRAANERNTS